MQEGMQEMNGNLLGENFRSTDAPETTRRRASHGDVLGE